MHKSFKGLSEIARATLELDPASGSVFLSTNKRRSMIKILYFAGTGYPVVAKRLEKGTFS